jgi:hypothetical protein
MCIDADIGRFVFTAGMILALSIGPARSIEFPGTCIKPPATVTNIAGINTRKAMMEGRYTLPDIIQACNQGYVDQGSYPTSKECIKNNRDLVNSPPLHAEADCVAGVITVEGLRTTLPAHADCASGGIRAIAAFKTLCPSYGGEIERAVPVFSQAGRESEDAGREAQRIADEVRSNASIANLGARKGLIAKMSVAATPTNPPTITGTTNLPNGTKLMATLTADRPCAPNCVAQAQTVVENGRFIVPSESIRGKIMAGPYTIEIVTPSAHLQPENVQAVIGRLGEYLEGPYVVTLSKDGYVPRSVNPSEFERMSGYSIRHVEKINVPKHRSESLLVQNRG